jgi:Helix-turn-helix domain
VSELTVALPDDFLEHVARRVAEILAPRFAEPTVWPEYMTIKQACEYAGFAPQRLYDLRSSGKLTRFSDGDGKSGSARISRAQLDELLVSRSRAVATSPRTRTGNGVR